MRAAIRNGGVQEIGSFAGQSDTPAAVQGDPNASIASIAATVAQGLAAISNPAAAIAAIALSHSQNTPSTLSPAAALLAAINANSAPSAAPGIDNNSQSISITNPDPSADNPQDAGVSATDASSAASVGSADNSGAPASSGSGEGNADGGADGSYNDGGEIKGPGTGTSDSVLAKIRGGGQIKVSNGEVILPKDTVDVLGGADFLEQLIRSTHKPVRKSYPGSTTTSGIRG
jgi:hypothetical protein